MAFELVPGLAAKDYVTDLKLCRVLFEDNKYYPWIFLVPMKENTKNMTNLSMDERFQLRGNRGNNIFCCRHRVPTGFGMVKRFF